MRASSCASLSTTARCAGSRSRRSAATPEAYRAVTELAMENSGLKALCCKLTLKALRDFVGVRLRAMHTGNAWIVSTGRQYLDCHLGLPHCAYRHRLF